MTTTYTSFISYGNVENAWKQAQKGGRKFRKGNILFSLTAAVSLVRLWNDLKNGTYKMGPYNRFMVYEPKERVVHAPQLRDKIVQFMTHEMLYDTYKNVFIKDSYACLKDKGTHKAVDVLQHYIKLCQWKYGTGWVVKLDVRKFFYSIDRNILKTILRKKIRDKDLLTLLDNIIDSSPEGKIGIPLGNISSQDFANIYLNELDQYVKRYLGIKWYVRYMDDVVAVVKTKEKAVNLLKAMQNFLQTSLRLETNNKTKIFPLKQGVNAYGYKIHVTHKLVRNSSKKRMKRRIKAMSKKFATGLIAHADVKQAVNAWLGHARHSNSYNLSKRIFSKYPYITVEEKGGNYFGAVFRHRRTGHSIP